LGSQNGEIDVSEPTQNPPGETPPKPPPPAEPVEPAAPLPKAKIERSRFAWVVWLVPVAAIGLCFWFFYRDFIGGGPTITIYFQSAEGLEENNTQIRYRGAKVGQVRAVSLAKDTQYVKVKARLSGSADDLARAGTVFWIVRPEFKIGSITGLRTIVSGEYIAVEPGHGPRTNVFIGAEKEPLPDQPGALRLLLLAGDLSTVQEQSPISYRGVEVGEVVRYRLGVDSQDVVVEARIRPEYAPLVRRNSVFWNAGRFNVSFGLFRGAQIGADSPAALLTGAIEFATPTDLQEAATNGTLFRLYDKVKDDWRNWAPVIPLHLAETSAPPATITPPTLLTK
jgi:paraquat-inducible protein B